MDSRSAIHAFVAVERERNSRAMLTFHFAPLGARSAFAFVLLARLIKALSALFHISSLNSATSRPPQPAGSSSSAYIFFRSRRYSSDATAQPRQYRFASESRTPGLLSSANSNCLAYCLMPATESGNSSAERKRPRLSDSGGLGWKNFG